LAEVISRVIQAVLGDLIPVTQSYNMGCISSKSTRKDERAPERPLPRSRHKSSAKKQPPDERRRLGGVGHEDRLRGEAQSLAERGALCSTKERVDRAGIRIVMVLSAAGQLLALLNSLDDWRTGVVCVMSFRYLSKQEGDCGCNRPLVEPCSHWMVMERLLELPEPGF
jgi:hypothetical protein